ncbi:MAG: SRPBCC family protein [Pseudomonadota bacterium]
MNDNAASTLLSDAEKTAIRAPVESARTLPRRAFYEPGFYAGELDSVLTNTWVGVGFDAQLPNCGDILPITVLGKPVLLVKGSDGHIRAFHNVCPYDGCEVAIEAASALKTIITPYHGWEYALDGTLLAANYWDGTPGASSVDCTDLNADLLPLACTQWMHTIFVYLGDKTTPFESQFAPVLEHFKAVDIPRLQIGVDAEGAAMINAHPIAANWKTVYENYSPNVYHEAFVHAMYRRSPHSPRVDENRQKTYAEINDPSGFLGLCYDNTIGASFYGESKLPKVRNRDGSPNGVNTIANVFPNWVTTVLGNAARIALFLPEGPESGTQVVATMFDESAASDPAMLGERLQSVKSGLLARHEDNRICESIQRARHSPAINSQFYSPFWDAMHYTLSNLVLNRLEGKPQ